MYRHIVLVVDDDQKARKAISRSLNTRDCLVITAENAAAGLRILGVMKVDIVISDYIMPGMSGLDFLEKVKKDYPDVLTILVSGHADLPMALQAINSAGVYKLLEKPWAPVEFAQVIIMACESRSAILKKEYLANRSKSYEAELRDLEQRYPGITHVETDGDGYILAIDPPDNQS